MHLFADIYKTIKTVYISLYTDLNNKFYLDKRTCATTVLNSMIKDCNPPKSGHRYVQYVKEKMHLRADHDPVKNT